MWTDSCKIGYGRIETRRTHRNGDYWPKTSHTRPLRTVCSGSRWQFWHTNAYFKVTHSYFEYAEWWVSVPEHPTSSYKENQAEDSQLYAYSKTW